MTLNDLLPCKHCGGYPYAYDMRGTGSHDLCTIECGNCDFDVEADTPEAAAAAWNLPAITVQQEQQ